MTLRRAPRNHGLASHAPRAVPRADEARAVFDDAYYAQQRPDIAAAGLDAWQHYAEHGWREGSRPHPLFDPAYYRTQAAVDAQPKAEEGR